MVPTQEKKKNVKKLKKMQRIATKTYDILGEFLRPSLVLTSSRLVSKLGTHCKFGVVCGNTRSEKRYTYLSEYVYTLQKGRTVKRA